MKWFLHSDVNKTKDQFTIHSNSLSIYSGYTQEKGIISKLCKDDVIINQGFWKM